MQIIGDHNVRVVPDVAVSGSGSGAGLVDGLLGMMLWNQVGKSNGMQPSNSPAAPVTELMSAELETAPLPLISEVQSTLLLSNLC